MLRNSSYMLPPRRPTLLCRLGAALGLATTLGSSILPANAGGVLDGLFLRPSLTATNYIHDLPVAPFSADFGRLIRNAVRHADGVQAAAARWQAEEFGVDEARGAQWPNAMFYGETGFASGGMGTSPYAYGVRVSLPVYDGNSRAFATEAQSATSNAARLAAVDELAATLVDLVASAAAIRRSTEILGIRQSQRAAMVALLGEIGSERETGTASRVDTDQVQGQITQIDVELRMTEASRVQARESFALIAGDAPDHVGVVGSLSRTLPRNAEAATAMALDGNPRLGQSLELAMAAAYNRDSVRSGLGPSLKLDLDAGQAGDFSTGISRPSASVMMRLEVPFTFGADARVQRMAHQAQAAEFEVSAARKGVLAAINGAYLRLGVSRKALSLATEAQAKAQAVLLGMRAERELGERSVFDLIGAQNAYAEAQIRIAELRYEVTVAEHLVAAQIGQIDEIYGITIDEL